MSSDPVCIAIIQEESSDLVVLDVSGNPRTFSYQGDLTHLCFSTHGAKGLDAFLTPCFDEDGFHGTPEEGCFCGIETPHIHAHRHNPKKCVDSVETGCKSKKKSNINDDIGYLASITLHPKDTENNLPNFPITEIHPKECNSEQVTKHFIQEGVCPKNKPGKFITKIKHGDHIDNLVHNIDTGKLHLEHNCKSCGDSDLHGEFDIISKRKLFPF